MLYRCLRNYKEEGTFSRRIKGRRIYTRSELLKEITYFTSALLPHNKDFNPVFYITKGGQEKQP